MKFQDLISMALKNLNARRLRTFLTVLGVIIGTTSIVIMLSIGFGFQKLNTDTYKSMGDLTTLDLNADNNVGNPTESSPKEKKRLNDTAVADAKKIAHVTSVMPMYKGTAKLTCGRYTNPWVNLIAIDPSVMGNFNFKLSEGRLLTQSDTSTGMVLSPGITKMFQDEKRPGLDISNKIDLLKSKIILSNISVLNAMDVTPMNSSGSEQTEKTYNEKIRVVGLLEDNANDWENYNSAYLSIAYFKKLIKSSALQTKGKATTCTDYHLIKVKVDDMSNVEEVQNQLKSMGYHASNMYAEILKQSNQQVIVVQAVFGAIGAIAFIVAAIGITNTMIMSIYERTKEIGVMKVIGAAISDIEKLFLVEAGFIGLFGGIFGILLSLLLSRIINFFASGWLSAQMMGADISIEPKISLIPFWMVILALLFSTLVGVLSGYLPAKRAMKLSALEAIRSE